MITIHCTNTNLMIEKNYFSEYLPIKACKNSVLLSTCIYQRCLIFTHSQGGHFPKPLSYLTLKSVIFGNPI